MANHGSGFVRKAGASQEDWDGIESAIRASESYARAIASITADDLAQHVADTLEELAGIAASHKVRT